VKEEVKEKEEGKEKGFVLTEEMKRLRKN